MGSHTDSETIEALKFMWDLVNAQITPDDILTYDEKLTGKTFWDGSAVFSRDWLYVWGLAFQKRFLISCGGHYHPRANQISKKF